MARILIIDDDVHARRLARETLESDGHVVMEAETTFGAIAIIREFRPDIILLDLAMPYLSGAAFLDLLSADGLLESARILVVSSYPDFLPARHWRLISGVVPKPYEIDLLLAAVAGACASIGAARERRGQRFDTDPGP